MDANNEAEETFHLGQSLGQPQKTTGILALGTAACKRLLKYAQSPRAEYKIVRDFVLSNFYSNRVEFDCNALSRLSESEISDCVLVLRLSCTDPERFRAAIMADLKAWKQLELTHANQWAERNSNRPDASQ